MIQFYKGESTKANSLPEGGILFTEDTHEIVVNKEAYGKTTHADESQTKQAITVAGGPLANVTSWPTDDDWNLGGNKTIPSGTSIQTILQKLFFKAQNGSATWGTAAWTTEPSWARPSVVLSTDSDVEVGTSVTITTLTEGTVTNGTRQVMCECTYGYFDALDGDHLDGDKVLSKTGVVSGTRSVVATWNGDVVADAAAGTSLTTEVGENKLLVKQSGLTSTASAFPDTTVYPSTNDRQVINSATLFSGDSGDSKTLSSENYDTVNAYYKYFYFSTTTAPEALTKIPENASSQFLTGYTTGDVTSNPLESFFIIPGRTNTTLYGIIMMPEDYKLKSIKTSVGSGATNDFNKLSTTFTYNLPSGKTCNYVMYFKSNDGSAPLEYKDLNIEKITLNN